MIWGVPIRLIEIDNNHSIMKLEIDIMVQNGNFAAVMCNGMPDSLNYLFMERQRLLRTKVK